VCPRCHRHRDLGQMQVHRSDVAAEQDEGCALAVLGADGAEDRSRRTSCWAPAPSPAEPCRLLAVTVSAATRAKSHPIKRVPDPHLPKCGEPSVPAACFVESGGGVAAGVAIHQLSQLLTFEWFCNIGFAAARQNACPFV
jgi:hypothetical protein